MRRRHLWLALTAAVAVCIGVGLLAVNGKPEWTTSNPQALVELQAAREAEMKLYNEDAVAHYERSLELDPNLVVAKVSLAQHLAHRLPERAAQLMDEAYAADLARLTPRERFLVHHANALRQGRYVEAIALVDSYLEQLPNDPFALSFKAEELWGQADLASAKELYQRLLDISPNWVVAYNNLGYLAMSQGRFAEAEEHFTSYRFIAPDQANPHDSLGELLVVVGRYDEAILSFDRALSIRPDFWLSYLHQILPHALQGSIDQARAVVDRAAERGCPHEDLLAMSCLVDYLDLLLCRSWEQIMARDARECLTSGVAGLVTVISHRAACETGTWHRALSLETALERTLAGQQGRPDDIINERLEPNLIHMRGVRSALDNNLSAAAKYFRKADRVYSYASSTPGVLKLWNRLMLVHVLYELGRKTEGDRIMTEVRATNPKLPATYKKSHLGIR